MIKKLEPEFNCRKREFKFMTGSPHSFVEVFKMPYPMNLKDNLLSKLKKRGLSLDI